MTAYLPKGTNTCFEVAGVPQCHRRIIRACGERPGVKESGSPVKGNVYHEFQTWLTTYITTIQAQHTGHN